LWGHGLKQRETRGIKIFQKLADFWGFFKDFGATPAGVLVPEEDSHKRYKIQLYVDFQKFEHDCGHHNGPQTFCKPLRAREALRELK
jgi:hypothetical protein